MSCGAKFQIDLGDNHWANMPDRLVDAQVGHDLVYIWHGEALSTQANKFFAHHAKVLAMTDKWFLCEVTQIALAPEYGICEDLGSKQTLFSKETGISKEWSRGSIAGALDFKELARVFFMDRFLTNQPWRNCSLDQLEAIASILKVEFPKELK